MKEELKQFNIDINDIKGSNNLIDNIHEAIHQMSLTTMKDRFEVILNNNLIEFKEKATNYRTIFGCRISYDNLPKDVSFIVREDTEPSYEKLQSNWNSLREIIKDCYKRYEDSNIELNDTYKYYLKSPLPPRYTMNLGAIELIDYILDKMNELEGNDKE